MPVKSAPTARAALPTACGITALFCALMAMSGCGSGLVKAHGKVLKNGEPLYVPGRTLQVGFHAMEVPRAKPNEAFLANLGPNSTFTVPGKDGKGIPPGKYRVSVGLMSTSDSDLLKGEFGPEKSTIVRDVTSAEEIVIDIGKPGG